MIKIIDSTLTMLDDYLPSKIQLLQFCKYMKEIGVVDLEISKYAYSIMEDLPIGFRFYLPLDPFDKQTEYPNIYHYYISRGENKPNAVNEFQVNDIKEIVHLRPYSDLKNIRIIGLDDLLCYDFVRIMKEIKRIFCQGEINFCPEDSYQCATALAVEWLLRGGKEVTTSFVGCGQRAATEEVYMAMSVVRRFKPNQSLEILVKLRELFEEITLEKVPTCKPVVGEKIFQVESGIHVDGIMKNPSNYEAYPPARVGQKTEVVMGKHSGKNAIIYKCDSLGLAHPSEVEISLLLGNIKKMSIQKRNSITEKEFCYLYKEVVTYE